MIRLVEQIRILPKKKYVFTILEINNRTSTYLKVQNMSKQTDLLILLN